MAARLVFDLLELAHMPPISASAARFGGKAVALARLLAAGLPVPPGFVIAPEALEDNAELTAPLADPIVARASGLGARLMVRSSASIEDRPEHAAPGLFLSQPSRAGLELLEAVAAVHASGRSPLVRSYLAARDIPAASARVAVVVQRLISARARGVAYSRLPGQPASPTLLVEAYGGDAEDPRSAEVMRSSRQIIAREPAFSLTAAQLEALAALVLMAEEAIEAAAGADVEWVLGDDGLWIVQARPIVHRAADDPRAAPPLAIFAFSRQHPGEVWHWDASHNPEPLSPAQAGLVERMDRAGHAPYRMRVVGGYLYTTEPRRPRRDEPRHSAPTGAELRRKFTAQIAPAMDAALRSVEGGEEITLDQALLAYERVFALYAAQLAPLIALAKRALPDFLAAHLGEREAMAAAHRLVMGTAPAFLEHLVERVAAGEVPFAELLRAAGPLAPAWDVATPTYTERPELLHRAVAEHRRAKTETDSHSNQAHELQNRLPEGERKQFAALVALAQAGREIGDLDDFFFARAQAAVRRALLARARQWRLAVPDDVFLLPLETGLQEQFPDPCTIRAVAAQARAEIERQRRWTMPLAFQNGRPLRGSGRRMPADSWRGRGVGGRARGRVIHAAQLARSGAPSGELILVAPAITPAMALVMPQVRGVVSEHGGLLDHGAALAREMGIPYLAGCRGAAQELASGDSVWMDAEAGLVVRLERAAGPRP